MAKRPTRRSVGERVNSSADRLSDALLGDEEVARQRMEDRFVAAIPDARRKLDRLYQGGLRKAIGDRQWRWFEDRMEDVIVECQPVMAGLLDEAVRQGLAAIRFELGLIEKQLGRPYAGLADMAVERVEVLVPRRRSLMGRRWVEAVAITVAEFEEAVEDDWRAAALREETIEDVDRRMFHDKQVNRPGHSGRGAWWKPFQSAVAAARGVEITLLNEVRVQAIYEFNKAGVVIRDGG